jgi:hypothetical protein
VITAEHPEPGLTEYRPISGWSLAALFVGLASIAAIFHPLLWSVPMIGVVVSLVALRQIKRSEVALWGRKAALTGLALSLLYGIAAPTRIISRDYWLSARAERLANTFLDLIRSKKTADAFALMRQSLEKKPLKPAPGSAEAAQPEPKSQREVFASTEPVKTLLALGSTAKIDHLSTSVVSGPGVWQAVSVLYEVHPPDEHSLNPLQVVIYVEQTFDDASAERWWIVNVTTPPPPRLSM